MEENRICYPTNSLGTIMQYNANTCEKCPDNKKCYEMYLRWSFKKTKKDNNYYQFANEVNNDYVVNEFNNNFYLKLQQLENIEEEIGCPIEVVIKALKEGSCGAVISFLQNDYNEIYQKGLYKPLIINGLSRECNTNKWCFCCYDSLTYKGYTFYLKDYKKTWWLKEDRSE